MFTVPNLFGVTPVMLPSSERHNPLIERHHDPQLVTSLFVLFVFLTTLDDPIQFSDDFRWFPLLPVLPSVCLHAPGNLPVP